jgi:hypothetical protein
MRQPGRRPPRGSADDAAGAAILSTGAGLLISLALLVRETPYTLTAFTFFGQPCSCSAWCFSSSTSRRSCAGVGARGRSTPATSNRHPGVTSIWLGNDFKDCTVHIVAAALSYRFK